MSINLSDLTSPNNQDIFAEITSGADFLDPIGKLENLSRGANAGSDALQTTALSQPKALPLIDGDGYLYVPDVVSNTCSTPDDSSIDITGDITIDIDLTLKNWNDGTERNLVSKYLTASGQRSYRLFMTTTNRLSFVISSSGAFESGGSRSPVATINFPDNQRAQIRVQWRSSDGRVQFFTSTDKGQTFTQLGSDLYTSGITSIYNGSADLDIAHRTNLNRIANSGIHSVQIYDSVTPSSSSLRFNCDFTATNVRHGDTKFKCATGQVVTINQSGNDPSTIIKKSVLRFSDAANTGLSGLFNQTITEGYMFAAFSVLGNGGEASGRVFSINSTGREDYQATGSILSAFRGTNLSRYRTNWETLHAGMSDDANGDILHEIKIEPNAQVSRVNNADEATRTSNISGLSAEEFNIGDATTSSSNSNAAIDLQYLALFPSSITDAQADSVRNYINNRNNVFSLVDNSYYFFDPQKATFTGNFTGSNTLDGYITGSDLGDTDVRSNLTLEQSTLNDQPSTDGYTITFNDAAEHLEFVNGASQNLSGWQICGTSLGTFVYRVQGAVSELNLLGNLGNSFTRKAGDLYGIILLPDSASAADIASARKLFIDRGASDSAATGDFSSAWRQREDIVEFNNVNMSAVTNAYQGWYLCNSLSEFKITDISNCTNFTSAFQGASALTSFPSGAKLGTEATGTVIFDNAWNSSGITSFSTPLPTATSAFIAWGYCSALTQFNLDLLPVVRNVSQAWRNTGLTSFNTNLPSATSVTYAWYQDTSLSSFGAVDIKSCSDFNSAWRDCSALTSFPSGAKLGTEATNVNFTAAWRDTGLTSFPNDIDLSKGNNFHATWLGNPITSFSTPLPEALDISYAWYQCSSLSSFSTPVLKSGTLGFSWSGCGSLTDFAEGLFDNWNPSSITSGVFNNTWDGCTSLTAQSVENILTSIDASGHYATTNKLQGGPALGDAGIDIDYNTATGTPAYSTLASLKSKGWSIIVNNVTL